MVGYYFIVNLAHMCIRMMRAFFLLHFFLRKYINNKEILQQHSFPFCFVYLAIFQPIIGILRL